MKNILNNNRGFTLIEVVTALLIFSVGILATQGMQYMSVKTNYSASSITRTIDQGVDTAERILALDYNDNNGLLDAGYHSDGDSNFPTEWEAGKNISITWQVTDDAPMPNMKTINMTITNSTTIGRDKTIPLTYYKAEII